MLLDKSTPTRYEISINPVGPARRPGWLGTVIILLLLAVAAVIAQRDEGTSTPPRPEHTPSADVRTHGQEIPA
ncbi:hypothetical protein CP970_19815 [Streptomyces kanamyceticus]|uniref:Uncharacterized protein n=1 Tax=Streptomyces kanamyceticus TaxID=1967 RepID=A0A5J6GG82_STRKN|nr:hypothetical protein CP970_19815 [Streptomyces kanamyceticus]